jgi:hypothetical protein
MSKAKQLPPPAVLYRVRCKTPGCSWGFVRLGKFMAPGKGSGWCPRCDKLVEVERIVAPYICPNCAGIECVVIARDQSPLCTRCANRGLEVAMIERANP